MKRATMMMMAAGIVLALAGGTMAQEPAAGFAAWVTGNSDVLQVRVGVAKENVDWGVSALHFPETDEGDSSYALGFWGAITTDALTLLQPDALPPFWGGLKAQAFADIDVDWDFENDQVLVMPGFGFRLEPAKTMSLIARAYYPLGDDPSPTTIDLNSMQYTLGLAVRF